MIKGTLSDSAFLVNQSRARAEDLSHDIYAKLWVDDDVSALWQLYNHEIYSHDPQALAVRNRFFLDNARQFFSENANGVFVNIGAGFTSYPYLLENPIEAIEIDLPEVIEYKRNKILEFQRHKLVPARQVDYLSANLKSAQQRQALHSTLKPALKGRPSFMLFEGISYYLERHSFLALMQMARDLQALGSVLAMDYWLPEVMTNPVFSKFCDFLHRRCGHPKQNYHFLSPAILKGLAGYEIRIESDVSAHERLIADELFLQTWEECIPENFVLLLRA